MPNPSTSPMTLQPPNALHSPCAACCAHLPSSPQPQSPDLDWLHAAECTPFVEFRDSLSEQQSDESDIQNQLDTINEKIDTIIEQIEWMKRASSMSYNEQEQMSNGIKREKSQRFSLKLYMENIARNKKRIQHLALGDAHVSTHTSDGDGDENRSQVGDKDIADGDPTMLKKLNNCYKLKKPIISRKLTKSASLAEELNTRLIPEQGDQETIQHRH